MIDMIAAIDLTKVPPAAKAFVERFVNLTRDEPWVFGFPIGGHSMVDGSSEVRLSVWGKVGAVAFVDYGNVWAEPRAFRLGELRYSVGPGLRYVTPVGPARVDFGWQLNPIPSLIVEGQPETRHWRIHFSIGQAF